MQIYDVWSRCPIPLDWLPVTYGSLFLIRFLLPLIIKPHKRYDELEITSSCVMSSPSMSHLSLSLFGLSLSSLCCRASVLRSARRWHPVYRAAIVYIVEPLFKFDFHNIIIYLLSSGFRPQVYMYIRYLVRTAARLVRVWYVETKTVYRRYVHRGTYGKYLLQPLPVYTGILTVRIRLYKIFYSMCW